jgi:hypothetical protein
MPTVHLDLFLTNLHPIQYLTEDFKRAVDRRLDLNRPVIVEGLLVQDALDQIGRKAGFVVLLKGDHETPLTDQVAQYQKRQTRKPDFILDGYCD